MGAGQYPDRLQLLQRSTSKDSSNGQDVETYTPSSYYWCRVEPTTGRNQRDYGAEQTGADVTIVVRNQPSISALDRMSDGTSTYILDNKRKEGKTELVFDGFYFDDLNL